MDVERVTKEEATLHLIRATKKSRNVLFKSYPETEQTKKRWDECTSMKYAFHRDGVIKELSMIPQSKPSLKVLKAFQMLFGLFPKNDPLLV